MCNWKGEQIKIHIIHKTRNFAANFPSNYSQKNKLMFFFLANHRHTFIYHSRFSQWCLTNIWTYVFLFIYCLTVLLSVSFTIPSFFEYSSAKGMKKANFQYTKIHQIQLSQKIELNKYTENFSVLFRLKIDFVWLKTNIIDIPTNREFYLHLYIVF